MRAACLSPSTPLCSMTVCAPQEAPLRSLRMPGDFLSHASSLGAPSVSLAGLAVSHDTTRHRLCWPFFISARFAPVRWVPTPASRSRLDPAPPVGQARLCRGQLTPLTPPRGLQRTVLPSRVDNRTDRSRPARVCATLTLAAQPAATPRGGALAACATPVVPCPALALKRTSAGCLHAVRCRDARTAP